MSFEISDRFSGLFEAGQTATPPRTAAQREASRRNGARSRGPRTPEGKHKSALNSVRHGVLASALMPDQTTTRDRWLFKKAHDQLVEQFGPRTFTQRALIADLASDYVSLARARTIVQAAVNPPLPLGDDADAITRHRRNRRLLRLLDEAASNAGRFTFAPQQAEDLAHLLAGLLGSLMDAVAEADQQPAPDAETAPAPEEINAPFTPGMPGDPAFRARQAQDARRELDELRAFVKSMGPAAERLANRDHLVAVLSGRRSMPRADHDRLVLLIARARKNVDLSLGFSRDAVRRVRRMESEWNRQLGERAAWLMLMQRYVARIEHAIERKVNRLGGA